MGAYKYWNPATQKYEIIKSKSIVKEDGSLEYTPDDIKAIDNKIGILSGVGEAKEKANKTEFDAHKVDRTNPHGTTKSHVGLGSVDNVQQMPLSGGNFTGISKAYSNTSYTVAQLRNVILSTSDAVVGSMQNGDIWIKYK